MQEEKKDLHEYVLLMAPDVDDLKLAGQIVVVNNSTFTGKKKVESYTNEGYTFVGRISDCPLPASSITIGFNINSTKTISRLREALRGIQKLVDDSLKIY